MQINCLVANVTAVGIPDRAEHAILGVILAGLFLANSGRICGWGAILWCRNPLLSPSTSTVSDEQYYRCRSGIWNTYYTILVLFYTSMVKLNDAAACLRCHLRAVLRRSCPRCILQLNLVTVVCARARLYLHTSRPFC